MARQYVARWAMVDALADEIADITYEIEDASAREIAGRLIESGWRPVGDDD